MIRSIDVSFNTGPLPCLDTDGDQNIHESMPANSVAMTLCDEVIL
jgi:hypothetical protein